MKKILEYKNEVFSLVLTLMIVLIFLIPSLNFNYFSYFDFKIPVENILAIILFGIILILKNNQKTNMVITLKRFGKRELIYSYAYYINIFVILLLIMYMRYLNFFLISITIILEVIIIITNYHRIYQKTNSSNILKYIKIKEIVYACMIILLLLGNYPFEIYNFPMDSILVIMYIVVQCNIVYTLCNE